MKKRVIIYFGIINFRMIKNRPQILAEGLAGSKDNLVIYVNPIYTILSPILGFLFLPKSPERKLLKFKGGAEKKGDNLYILTPPLLLPFFHLRIITYLNNFILAKIINSFLKKIGSSKVDILWLSHPNQCYFYKWIKYKQLVYDIMDNCEAVFKKGSVFFMEVAKKHQRLISQADIIFITSFEFRDSIPEEKKVTFLPNAYDHNLFDPKKEYQPPQNIKGIKNPIVGFLGAVERWVDLVLVKEVAQKHPEWSFVFVGPKRREILSYQLNNIYFLGEQKREDLPSYLYFFDLAIIPFLKNDFTDKLNPVKFFEYLAMEKPVIARRTKELEKYKDYCFLYETKEEFEDLLEKVMGKKISSDEQKIKDFISHQTWEGRIKRVKEILNLKDN